MADVFGAGPGDPDEWTSAPLFRHQSWCTASIFITVGDHRAQWWLSHSDVLRHPPTTLRSV